MKYSNETSLIGKAANSLDIKGAIIGKTLDFIIQFINNKVNEKKWKNLFLETGENTIHENVKIPQTLQTFMKGEKKSVELPSTFIPFKRFLMEQ